MCAGCCLCFGALLPWPRIRRSCGLFAVDFVLESCFIGRGYSDLAVCLRAVVQVYVLESCCIGGGYRSLFVGRCLCCGVLLYRRRITGDVLAGCRLCFGELLHLRWIQGSCGLMLSFVFWRAPSSSANTVVTVLWCVCGLMHTSSLLPPPLLSLSLVAEFNVCVRVRVRVRVRVYVCVCARVRVCVCRCGGTRCSDCKVS